MMNANLLFDVNLTGLPFSFTKDAFSAAGYVLFRAGEVLYRAKDVNSLAGTMHFPLRKLSFPLGIVEFPCQGKGNPREV
ncbi:MAG TPA: hypothetical protein VF604_09550 [Pyrinomonadaceae bacterium]|jgi:hypothetical protein